MEVTRGQSNEQSRVGTFLGWEYGQSGHLPGMVEVLIFNRSKKLLITSATLLETSALLVVTTFAIRNKCLTTRSKKLLVTRATMGDRTVSWYTAVCSEIIA